MTVVIPAYKPSAALPALIQALRARGLDNIVLIDDGSGPAFGSVFASAAEAGARLLRHGENRGKGAALRTGLAEALQAGSIAGIVTADADGQHETGDIARVAAVFSANPAALVLGCRDFSHNVPLRNRAGNNASVFAMRYLAGMRLVDTQTGLRAIPAGFARRLLRLDSDGYEFELEMLIEARDEGIALVQEPIRTIYEPGGESHFRPLTDSCKIAAVMARAISPRLCLALTALAAAGEIYGFAGSRLLASVTWYPAGFSRLAAYGGYLLAFGLPFLLMAPWTLATLAAASGVVLTAVPAGPLAVLAAAFFLLSSCTIGSWLVGDDSAGSLPLAASVGTGGWIFVMTLTARMPVHYAATWCVLLALPIAIDARGAWRCCRMAARAIGGLELRGAWERAAFGALVLVLGIQWLAALRLESSADGLAMHLAIPTNIAAHHAFTLEPARIVWSVMPMGADWTYSIVYLLGGEMAARLLNFAMLLLIEALLYAALRRAVGRGLAFFLMALFATTPLALLVTGSLFVENLVALLVLAVVVATWRFKETRHARFLYAAAILGGAALESKYGALAFVGAAAVTLVAQTVVFRRLRFSRGGRRRKTIARPTAAAALFLLIALAPYAIAWWKTGDPLFPYLNGRFPSPLLPPGADLTDYNLHAKPTPNILWDLTFHTHLYYEGQDGGFGFQYLLLIPIGVCGLALRRRGWASAGWVAVVGSAAVLASKPNARYVYAALPLATLWGAAGLAWMSERRPGFLRLTCGLLTACLVLNLWFLPVASWYNREWCLPHPFQPHVMQRLAEAAPVRVVETAFRRAHPGEWPLLTTDNDLADLAGDAYQYHWHEIRLSEEIRTAPDLPAMVRIMERNNIRYIIARRPDELGWIRPTALRELFNYCTTVESKFHDIELRRLDPGCEGQTAAALQRRIQEAPLPTSLAGWYDDFGPAIRFRGDWVRTDGFNGPYLHSVSYSDAPGSEADFAFQGRSLSYVFARAPNRGIADVFVDGKLAASVDQWARGIAWQSRQTLCCFGPGRHEVAIRVAGRKRPEAEAAFIDVDALIVE